MSAPKDCDLCPVLAKVRNGVVNGRTVGKNPHIMIVGQNPGRQEDEQLTCWVGDAGKILVELVRRADIDVHDVFFSNAVRCWTPANRKPKKDEWFTCREYLIQEIADVQPGVLVALGEVALHSLYKRTSVASVAGQSLVQPDTGIPLIATYHPAYLLRGAWNAVPLILSHLAKAKRLGGGAEQEEELGEYHAVTTLTGLTALKQYLLQCPIIAVDSETTGKDWKSNEILCVSFSGDRDEGYTVPVLQKGAVPFWEPGEETIAMDIIGEILRSDVPKLLQNGPFDLRFFEREQNDFVEAKTAFGWEVRNFTEDTMQMHKAIAENLPKESHPNELPTLLATYTGMPPYEEEVRAQSANKTMMEKVENDVLWKYAGGDVDGLHRLRPPLTERLDTDGGSRWVYDNITMPMIRCCQAMTMRGILVDRPYFDQLCKWHDDKAHALDIALSKEAGIPFNHNSPQQIQHVFRELGVPFSGRKTDAATDCDNCDQGRCTIHDQVSEEALLEIKTQHDHPILDLIIERRSLDKRRGTYLAGTGEKPGGFLAHIRDDDRIHCQFNTGGAATGRLSSSEPNGQNVPNKEAIPELGQKNAFRRTFIAPEGSMLMEADWAQLEVWVMAYRTGDQNLLEVLESGRDVHTFVARNIWKVDTGLDDYEWRKEHEDIRTNAKVFTFGIQYGLTVHGIEERLGCSESEAAYLLGMYFDLVPRLRDYFREVHETILSGGVLENVFGRRRRFPEVPVMRAAGGWKTKNAVQEAMRVAVNFPIQSGGSDLHALAGHIPSEFTDLRNYAKLLLGVHDSCVFEVKAETEADILDVAWKTKQLWQSNAQNLILPNGKPLGWQIPVEIKWGPSWGELDTTLNARGEVFHETDEAAA